VTDTDWDPDDYDDDHGFVTEYGTDLVDALAPEPGERVLDLGCGTGHLTARAADAGATAVGVDAARSMVARAGHDHPDLPVVVGDARALPFDGAFDAAVSNAALHWIPEADQDDALRSVHDALRPGGRFVAELGGTGNVAAIREAVAVELRERGYEPVEPWYFPTVGAYASRLEDAGFEVREARLFDRPTELEAGPAAWLEMFGDELLAPVPAGERDAVVDAVESRLRSALYRDGTWVADYRRLRFLAVR
jgi:SAM-dependent methyltransferase